MSKEMISEDAHNAIVKHHKECIAELEAAVRELAELVTSLKLHQLGARARAIVERVMPG